MSLPPLVPPGRLRYTFIRYGLRFFISLYQRVRVEGADILPTDTNYLVCFNHPGWLDPMVMVAYWPDPRRWVYIFGPKEADMQVGGKNRITRWSRIAVPFRPSKDDLIDTTRRAVRVIKAGFVLAVAGEGRLSDLESEVLPLQDGPAYFALRAGVPIVPAVLIGTRWIRFRGRVTLRIGRPIGLAGRRADREGIDSLTAELQPAMQALLAGVTDASPPGRFGRWLTDVFNDRPWLDEPPDA
jgi:1-acyl-sn-glycerol-3-phosphate acyltransferase